MSTPASPTPSSGHRWVVFWIVCIVYFFVYFHRVSTSVIATDLLAAFNTNATALGIMSSMYFYLYAVEQPLVGYLTDRLGPRRVIGYWSLVAAAGCFIFGLAPTIAWAAVGRGLIGLGVGGVYVPALKSMAVWFRKNEFAGLLGILMSVGNLGAVIATSPLAWASSTWGWRPTFFMVGAVSLGLAAVVLAVTRDRPADMPEADDALDTAPPEKTGARHVLSSGQFWIAVALFFGVYGTFVTLQGLWATPFLMAAESIDRLFASKLNMLIPLGVIVGAPLIGWVCDRFGVDKRRLLIGVLAVYIANWIGLIFFHRPLGIAGLSILQFVMGLFAGGFVSILWAIVREATPPHIMGLTSGLLNPAPILGIAAFQTLTGAILDRADKLGDLYSLAGFKNAFMACLAANLVCFVLAFRLQKPGKLRS